jgi:hypothetical protein
MFASALPKFEKSPSVPVNRAQVPRLLVLYVVLGAARFLFASEEDLNSLWRSAYCKLAKATRLTTATEVNPMQETVKLDRYKYQYFSATRHLTFFPSEFGRGRNGLVVSVANMPVVSAWTERGKIPA